MLKYTPLLFPGLFFASHEETNLCLCLLPPSPPSSSPVRRISPVLKWFVPSRLGRRSHVTMVPAFLEKATKCVNAAPVRGVSIFGADGVCIAAFVVGDIKILHFVIFNGPLGTERVTSKTEGSSPSVRRQRTRWAKSTDWGSDIFVTTERRVTFLRGRQYQEYTQVSLKVTTLDSPQEQPSSNQVLLIIKSNYCSLEQTAYLWRGSAS